MGVIRISPTPSPNDYTPSYSATYVMDGIVEAVGTGQVADFSQASGVIQLPSPLTIPFNKDGAKLKFPGIKALTIQPAPTWADPTQPLIQFQKKPGSVMPSIQIEGGVTFDDGGIPFSGTFVDFSNPSGSGNTLAPGHFSDIRVKAPNVTGRAIAFDWNYGSELDFIHVSGGPSGVGAPAWNGATAYVVGNIVQQGGLGYICELANTNQQPPNATYWDTIPGQKHCSLSANFDTGEGHLSGCQVKGQYGSVYLKGNLVTMKRCGVGYYIMLDSAGGEPKRYGLDGVFTQNNIPNYPVVDNVGAAPVRLRWVNGNAYIDGTANVVGSTGGGGGNLVVDSHYGTNSGASIAFQSAGWTRKEPANPERDWTNLT